MTTTDSADTTAKGTQPVRRKRRGNGANPATTIDQVLSLRSKIRDLLAESNELIRTIKRQRRQQRLMQTTLKSLKELQAAG